jgi:hypothetical protein
MHALLNQCELLDVHVAAPVACLPAAIATDAQCIVHILAGQALYCHMPHITCGCSNSSNNYSTTALPEAEQWSLTITTR